MENDKQLAPRATAATSYLNPQHWNVMKVMAETFYKSGALPAHINNAPKLMMILQTGVEIGFKPMQAINSLYIVNGRIAMSAQAMLGKLLQSHVKLDWVQDSPTVAEVKFSGLDRPTYTAKFTIEEAQKAGLVKQGGPWTTYPAAMLRARAISIGARVFCPDIISGSYTLDEVAEVRLDEDGHETIEAERSLAGDNKIPAAPQGNKALPPKPTDPNIEIKRLIAAECVRLGVDLHDEQFKQRIFEKTGYQLDDPLNFSIILDTLKEIPTPEPTTPTEPENPENPTPPPAGDAPQAPETPREGTGETPEAQTPAEDVIVPPSPETAATADAEPEPEEDPVAKKARLRAESIEKRNALPEDQRASKNTIGLFQSLLWQREGVEQANEDAQLGWLFMVKDIDIDKLEQLTAAEVSKINKDLLAKPARKE